MHFKNGSRHAGTQLAAIAIVAVGLMTTGPGWAETIFTVNGVDVDSAVVDIYFESRLGQPDAQPTPEQRTVLISELRDVYLLSTQELANELVTDPKLAAQIELQRRAAIARAVAGKFYETVTVTEEEILAEYQEQIDAAAPLQFKARHILVPTQGEAVDLISQLDGGANFEDLAKEKSTGPSATDGGNLDWFSPDQMVAPFSNAVADLEDGAYTPAPVQTQFGWHVILREGSRESTPPTLESVRDSIDQQVQQKKFEAHMVSLRSASVE